MSALADARASVTARLTSLGDVTVTDHVPERLTPPAAVVSPGTPYIARPEVRTFGSPEWVAALVVSLAVEPGESEVITDDLDDLLCRVVAALGDDVAEVSGFYAYQSGTAQYLAADVRLTIPIEIEE